MIPLMRPKRPNSCPVCGGPLHLSEIERVKYSLNMYGEKQNFEEEFYDAKLVCNVCKTEFDADKKGNHFFVKRKLPPVKLEIKSFNPFQLPNK